MSTRLILNRVMNKSIITIYLMLTNLVLSGCSSLSGGYDRPVEVANDVVFEANFCVKEKRELKTRYFMWKDCYTSRLSKKECVDLETGWKEKALIYSECRDEKKNETLLINPFHLFRK